MSRFPSWVYRGGLEPDPRFSLAKERTFLAWVRTALALLAGGVGLEALHIPAHAGLRLSAAGVLLVLGLLAVVQGWVGWARTDAARRYRRVHGHLTGGRRLPSAAAPITFLVASVAVFALACGAWLAVSAG